MNSIETHVLQLIGEDIPSPDVFTDDETGLALIRGSVNDAIQEMCMVTGAYTKTYHLILLADRQFYRISAKQDYFGCCIEVWDRNRKLKLTQIDLVSLAKREPSFMTLSGDPDYYGHCGTEHVFVFPRPSSEGTVLEIRMAAIPKPYLSDKDPVKVRDQWQQGAAYLAVSEYFASRGDASRAGEYLTKYLEVIGMKTMHPMQAERTYQLGGYKRPNQADTRRTEQ